MSRTTVDFGIDLGTTNSSIAVLRDNGPEVIRTNDNSEITPSFVWMDKAGELHVGLRARNRGIEDVGNSFFEFKGEMGTDVDKTFERSARRVKPYDLSAEVLKSLRSDVRQRTGEDLTASVITVPAAFELVQCNATKRAAELAGITHSPLLLEPVAAALAYGFRRENDRAFWLVYDLGGGTFDAAVIQMKEGMIRVVNHEGDNHLGGKLIDWAIVDRLLAPALTNEFALTDFNRSNKKWEPTFFKLKYAAEQAKISLSRSPTDEIVIPHLCGDDHGNPVEFEYLLKREDVERLAEPFILRSINIAKSVLAAKQLGIEHVEKVILVGGPTLMPYIRARLADERDGLGLPLDFENDPLTVVSRGAAIFAGTQLVDSPVRHHATIGQYLVELDYKPVGSDIEPLIGGRVVSGDGEPVSGLTIEFLNSKTRWRSGKITVVSNGTFRATLYAEKGGPNIFAIELRDSVGTSLVSIPNQITYTVGLAATDPPLIHSIGVAQANGETHFFFEKGTALPARRRFLHRQAYHVHKGRDDEFIRIPVVEGEHSRADRNQQVELLEISGMKLRRDVPPGSEVEVTIEIDQSRLIKASAYIPILDEEIEVVLKLEKGIPDAADLLSDAKRQKERLLKLRQKANEIGEEGPLEILSRIDDEEIEREIEGSLTVVEGNPGEAIRCQHRLLDLKVANDQLEDTLDIPSLRQEAANEIAWTAEVVNESEDDERSFQRLRRDLELVMNGQPIDVEILRRKIDEMNALRFRIQMAKPEWWVGYFEYLSQQKEKMTDQVQASMFITQGQRSINSDDLEALKSACRQLLNLLPLAEQDKAHGYGGTTVQQ